MDVTPTQRRKVRPELLRAVARRELGVGISTSAAIPRRGLRVAPLSYSQSRLWFLDQLKEGSGAYNVAAFYRLTGPLDERALESALAEIVHRHEVLRTTFGVTDGAPAQRIHDTAPIAVPVVDLSSTAPDEREGEALRRLHEEAARPFDLERGPLFRPLVIRLDQEDRMLLLAMHHIVSDGWSRGVLLRELRALYNVFAAGRPSPLPELPIQYADYAAWQREWLQGEVLERQIAFWKEHLAGAPALLELPTDRPRSSAQAFRGAHQRFALPPELTQALKTLAQREGATLFMTLLAAFQALLNRYSGQEDIVVGTPIANRTRPELESLIGFFLNTLALRGDLSGDPSFRELLRRVRETTLEAYAHQDLPFEKLVEELHPERSLSHSPIFQATFALQNVPRRPLELEGLSLEPIASERVTAKFDVSLTLWEGSNGMLGAVEYNAALFDEERIARLLEHFRTLLAGIAADPDRRISSLPMLAEAERQQLLIEWNATDARYPREACIHHLVEQQARERPGALAVKCAGQSLTYRELNDRANRLANHLRRRGVGPEGLVGVFTERSIEMVVAMLGILKAGGAYLPLDPSYPPERLAFMLEDSRVRVLLTQGRLRPRLTGQLCEILCLDTDPRLQTELNENPSTGAIAGNLAYVIYTSGSTGRPKAVTVSHRNLLNLVSWHVNAYQLTGSDRSTQVARFSFDASVWETWPALASGGALYIAPEEVTLSAPELAAWLKANEISVSFLPTPMAEALLGESACSVLPLRALLTGGDRLHAVPWATLPFALVNHYGPTECTVVSTAGTVELGERHPAPPIGRPISNTRVYLLDPRRQLVPAGVAGELYIGGESVARGYLNQPGLTAEKFVPDPFGPDPGARLYRTGDICRYLPDGNIDYVGRADDQVKIRGFRIELGEIESALSQYAGVREAAALSREDTPGDKRLVAYVVSSNGALPASELREHLRARLPEYMVPSAFVTLEALPLTPNGKLDRKALPAPEAGGEQEDYVAPRTPVEEGLAEIWSEVLRVERVGIHDSFFELGGHSLLATQVISRIRKTFQVEIPLRALFEAPTIAGLAGRMGAVRAGETDPAPPIEPVSREGPLPLSFAQQRLWFLEQFEPGSPVYSIPTARRLTGALDIAALQESLNELVCRHEVLRTTFSSAEGDALQVVHAQAPLPLPLIDLSGLPAQEREAQARQQVTEEARLPFNLERGPLFRASLIRLDEEDHILLLTMHHIVSDGWSMGVLTRELNALYSAYREGRPSPLAELPVQYADYAAWQRNRLQGEVLERQLAYWREHLQAAPTLLELPTDRPRPAVQRFRGARQRVCLSAEVTQGLRALGQEEGVTLFMTLLAGFQALLHRYSRQEEVVVGTPIANRTQAEVEGLIGFFVNTLALKGDFAGDPSFREMLGRVREAALGAYAHQELPFEKLVDELQPQRSLSHTPIFQVMFALQNAPDGAGEIGGLTSRGVGTEAVTAKFDLLLALTENGGEIRGSLEYNTDLFDEERIERLIEHLGVLLEGIVADPDQAVSRLPILTEAERRQLADWNDTARDYPLEGGIHELIEAQVRRTPDAIALVFEDRHLSYDELNRRANRLARFLQHQGVGPDVLVGLCMERSVELVVGLLAVLKAGGAYVPLDPSYPPERLRFMAADAAAPVLLTQRHLAGLLPGASSIPIEEAEASARSLAEENPASTAAGGDLAYMIYTSGSTGQPKGAMNTHRGIRNRLLWMQEEYGLTSEDRILQKTPFSFDVSVWEFLWPLMTGAALVVAKPEGHKDPAYLVRLVEQERITTMHFVPSMLRVFLEEPGLERCVHLKRVICSGEALAPDLQDRFSERLGAELHNLYGPTEAAVDVTYWSCQPGSALSSVPIGKPVANTQIHLLDRHLQPVPIGVPAELYIGGLQVARGYHNRPELTREKFLPDPFRKEPGAQLYRTGDLCRYLPDGNIEYLGRIDHQVKIRGFRIELGEIESRLLEHPGVGEAVVLAREESASDRRLVAYAVPSNGALNAADLREHLKEKLPEYMVPSTFVFLEALPLSPNGKIDRKALPAPEIGGREDEYLPPQSAAEETLAKIWSEVLRVERVGIHDNFFELGGDSILSIRIIARANQAGLRFTPKQVFQHQTIAALAAVAGTGSLARGEQGTIIGAVPLTPIQRWFFQQELCDAHHFNQARVLRLQPGISPQNVERAIAALVDHHDALRLRFQRADSGWQQTNAAVEENAVFSLVDLWGSSDASDMSDTPDESDASGRSDLAAALTAKAEQLQASLNLESGPLLRACYFDCGAREPARLLIAIHHLAVDGVSWRVLLEDLETAIGQLARGEEVALPAKTTSFQQWANLLVKYAGSEALRKEAGTWLETARKPASRLPVDYPEGDNSVATQRVVRAALSVEETKALLTEVPAAYHTQVNDVLLTALAQAFAGWTGERRVLVDLEGHGREAIFEEADLSRTVGWFTSLYPVTLELPGSPGVGEALKSVKEQLRAIPNRGVGYGVLRYLGEDEELRRKLAEQGEAEVSFNYHGQFEGGAEEGDGLIAPASESAGAVHSPRGKRSHLIDVIGMVAGERLQVSWVYSESLHQRSTIERLAEGYLATLRSLIAHCRSEEAGGFTPSDFPDAMLSQKALDRLLTGVRR